MKCLFNKSITNSIRIPQFLTQFLYQAYRGGQRGQFAPGGTLRGGGAQKRKKEKRKRRTGKKGRKKGKKREKDKMGEACNYSKSKLEYLSCGAPMHV